MTCCEEGFVQWRTRLQVAMPGWSLADPAASRNARLTADRSLLRQRDRARSEEAHGAISHLPLTVVTPAEYLAARTPSAGENVADRYLDPVGESRGHGNRYRRVIDRSVAQPTIWVCAPAIGDAACDSACHVAPDGDLAPRRLCRADTNEVCAQVQRSVAELAEGVIAGAQQVAEGVNGAGVLPSGGDADEACAHNCGHRWDRQRRHG